MQKSIVERKIDQTESETQLSTALSEQSVKESIVSSIPSEAPPPKTSDSDSVLPLIEETFETSVSALKPVDASVNKPFRKNAKCSAQNHMQTACAHCEMIENDLHRENNNNSEYVESDPKKPSPEQNKMKNLAANETQIEVIKPQNRTDNNVWQVSNLEKYETHGKFSLSPITVFSATDTNTLNNASAFKSSVDSSSFIVLHDENENAANFFPNITSTEPSTNRSLPQSTKTNTGVGFNRPCVDCCFCNPMLHHNSSAVDGSPKKCNFCSSRHQSMHTTPANSSRFQTSNTNIDASARSSTAPTELYESKYRSNHTHIRTHSRDSDTINTQCTKKTNRKIRKTILNGSDDVVNGNAENNNKPNGKHEDSAKVLNGNETTNSKKRSTIPKLPPPTYHEWTSNSVETSTSPSCSSISTGSSTKSGRQNSKSVPNLPKAERNVWPNNNNNNNNNANETNGSHMKSTPNKPRTNSRYQEFYGTVNSDEQRGTIESKTKEKATGIFVEKSF